MSMTCTYDIRSMLYWAEDSHSLRVTHSNQLKDEEVSINCDSYQIVFVNKVNLKRQTLSIQCRGSGSA